MPRTDDRSQVDAVKVALAQAKVIEEEAKKTGQREQNQSDNHSRKK